MSESGGERPRAVRLTFAFHGDDVRLVARQPVDVVTPPSDEIEGAERRQGFWAELQAGDGRPLYRRVMRDPARGDTEVFAPGGSPSRAPVPEVRGTFSVVVPDVPDAEAVVLHSSSAGVGDDVAPQRRATLAHGRPAREWARFPLRQAGEAP